MNKIRTLIVDDSAFIRKTIELTLKRDNNIEVVGTARNGKEGVEKAKELKPDIITLDVEMPIMNGLEALEIIMRESPTNVIMVSSLTSEGAELTLKALQLGAVDFIPKDKDYISLSSKNINSELVRKIHAIGKGGKILKKISRQIGGNRQREEIRPKNLSKVSPKLDRIKVEAIQIGISTGGPLSLQKVMPRITNKLNIPIFIVQHMPPKFTKSLADRLNGMSEIKIKEAEDGEPVIGGVAYIAPGGKHMGIKAKPTGKIISLSDTPSGTLHKPSVDVTLKSVVDVWGERTMGIIMTGMGKDGLEGAIELKKKNGIVIAQDEESSVVWGMPKAVFDKGIADMVVPLEKIGDVINKVIK